MKMIGHQAEGMHLPARFQARLPQRLQEQAPILVGAENGLPPVTAIHHMINRPGIFEPQFSSHAATLWQHNQFVKTPIPQANM